MKEIIGISKGLCKLMNPDDIFALDSRFCDVISDLENKGFEALIQNFKGHKKTINMQRSKSIPICPQNPLGSGIGARYFKRKILISWQYI